MNAKDLMEAIGELDASLVAEALASAAPRKKRPAQPWLRIAAAAAVFLLVAGGVLLAVSRLPRKAQAPELSGPAATTEANVSESAAQFTQATPTTAAAETAAGSTEAAATAASAPTNAAPTGSAPASRAETAALTEPEAAAEPDARTKAADPTTAAVTRREPATEAPSTKAAAAEAAEPAASSWWERLFGDAELSAAQGDGDPGLLQWIADLFSGGGAGENRDETVVPETEAPAGCYHAFYWDFSELENRAAAYRGMPVTEKTQAELESLYGGPFLPTVFPGAAAPPQESSGAIHGVRRYPTGETVLCNEYLYVWTLPEGGSRSLSMTVDDGGYFPSGTIETVCRTYRAGAATVYWLADTCEGAERHLAIAARGENVVFTFTLTGECGDEDFLRTVASALGC